MIDIHLKHTWPLRKGIPEGGVLEKTTIIGSHQRLVNAIGIFFNIKKDRTSTEEVKKLRDTESFIPISLSRKSTPEYPLGL